ncbi:MAG TPA: hypothetical protein VN578_10445 [Candidatus Binatia bacterium]|nr:hypothetical protein [Candidatus Binatia bacterium]
MPKAIVKTEFRVEDQREFLLEAPELAIFMACLGLVNEMRWLEHAFKQRELSPGVFRNRLNAALSQLTRTAEATQRFDIVMPVMEYGQFSSFFWKWFNWWDDYLSSLSPRQLGQLVRLARERKRSVLKHYPKDHWVAYRKTPAFTIVVN